MKYDTNEYFNLSRAISIMGEVKIIRDGFSCERCGYKWVPKKKSHPRVCPKCKSAWWDVPKKIKKRGR